MMLGKTVLITGAKEGIGFKTALALAQRKCRLIMADVQDLQNTKQEIFEKSGNENITTNFIDFASFKSVREFANRLIIEEPKLNVIINNAGVFTGNDIVTEDGLLTTMQVNHFGPFLMTYLLADLLKRSAPSRIIFVSSVGAFFHNLTIDNLNEPNLFPIDAVSCLLKYYNSKLCNIIIANGFAQRLRKFDVTSNSLHPGMTGTNFLTKFNPIGNTVVEPIFGNLLKLITQDVENGAESSIFLATSKTIDHVTGKFFVDFRTHEQPRITNDKKFCNEIWRYSEMYTQLNTKEKKFGEIVI